MNFKHPQYPDIRPYMKTLHQSETSFLARAEFPDGLIVVFDGKVDGLNISSNVGFKLNANNELTPWFDKPNAEFKDVI